MSATAGGPAEPLFGALPALMFRDLLRAGCVTLVGPPRAGKGALVRRLSEIWEAQGGLVRALDLAGSLGAVRAGGDIDATCRADLLRALGVPDAQAVPAADFQSELARRIGRQPPRTLLVLDHCEAVPHDIAQALLKALRAALQEQARHLGRGGLSLLLVTAGSIAGIAAGVTSPFLNMTVVHRLADLDAAAARAWLAGALDAAGVACATDAVAALVDWLGGDRDLLQRALAALVREPPAQPMDRPTAEALIDVLLATVAARPVDWPLARELLDGLRDSALLFGIVADLQGGGDAPLRELRRDIGVAEASGFVTQTTHGYSFRSPFHAALARRLLSPRTLGDLAVIHGDWLRARGLYASASASDGTGSGARADGDPFGLADLGLGLATCLLQTDDSDALLRTLTEMLGHCLGLRFVNLLKVRGADPAGFVPLAPLAESTAGLLAQVETCTRRVRPEASRSPQGQCWAVPLAGPGAADGRRVHAVALFTLPDRAVSGLREEALRLCLLTAQGLAQRLEAERDRAFARITASIHAAADLPATLGEIALAALDLTGADFSSLEFWDGGALSTQAVRFANGPPPRDYEPLAPQALATGVTGQVHRTGEPMLIGNWSVQSPDFTPVRMVPGITGAVSEAAVPIRLQDRPLGVINVESVVLWRFTNDDIAVLERLAELAAIAIDNASRLDRSEHDAILGRVFAGIAHEANNHAAAIGLRAALTNRHLEAGHFDATKIRNALAVIERHADAMLQLAEDFRWLTRPGPDREGMPIPLAEVIAEAVAALPERLDRSLATGPDISVVELVSIALPEPPGPVVCGRPRLLRRALENLLQNACEAVFEDRDREGRRPVAGDVSIRLRAEAQMAVIEVCDRGPGIADPGEAFEPYYTTKGARGLGLGLSIVRQVIEAHAGQVHVSAGELGRGTCFRILLPIPPDITAINSSTSDQEQPR